MELTPKGMIINGFKATDENMCCSGFQYELDKWYEHEGDIELCQNGFHFCEYPSGPWLYYIVNARIFRIEAEEVLKSNDTGTGTAQKHVCKRIRLVEEINIIDSENTGNYNLGDWNTGLGNAGDYHSGALCFGTAPFYIFNKPAKREYIDFNLVKELALLMLQDDVIDPEKFLSLPNASIEAIAALHEEHKKYRKEKK